MQVRNISNYSLGVAKTGYNNKSAKVAPNFTAGRVPTQGVFEYRTSNPFKDLLVKISTKIVGEMNKYQGNPTVKKEVLKMTPESKALYEKVQKQCDGSATFFTPKKSPILQKMADFYRNEEIMSARNAKK